MVKPRFQVSLIACLLLLATAGAILAAERNYWRHSKGHFENTKENRWEEKSPDGTYHFVEKKRTDRFVELYDRKRQCTVRLFNDHCNVKFGDEKFQKLYEGKWGGK